MALFWSAYFFCQGPRDELTFRSFILSSGERSFPPDFSSRRYKSLALLRKAMTTTQSVSQTSE